MSFKMLEYISAATPSFITHHFITVKTQAAQELTALDHCQKVEKI